MVKKLLETTNLGEEIMNSKQQVLRWPVPIYMRVGYVFDSRFS